MKAIVLAAGEGKRMRPLTAARPKVMLPVAGVPMLERLVRQLVAEKVGEITIVTSYQEAAVRSAMGDGSRFGCSLRYARQEQPRGTGDAAVAGLREARIGREPFLILNGDVVLSDADLARFVAASSKGPVLSAAPVPDPKAFGVFRMEGDRPKEIVEKSAHPPSSLANAGLYGFPAEMSLSHFEKLEKSPRGEFEITDAVSAALRRGVPFELVELPTWQDVGRPWDLLSASERLLKGATLAREGTIEPGATLHGAVHVGPGTLVRAGSYIEGPVWIGRDASIGPNCYIRPNSVIGDRVRIGNAVEVKASVIMDDTHVGHLSYVGDSVLGFGVNFGAGTKVANLRHDGKTVKVEWEGARIDTGRRKMGVIVGDGVHTGINTSLNVGVVLGPHATTMPGEVVIRSRS
ncbi:MAG: bifunctional sugar-1-phosphate nucleotidylyltransferase/acetyltransferase [Thermoplasmatota archaeon]